MSVLAMVKTTHVDQGQAMSDEAMLGGLGSLAIVTIALNEATNLPALKASIDQLRQESPGVELLTVLVDTGSSDRTVSIARTLSFDLVIEAPGSNIPAARNIGARATNSQWIGFIDADCRPQVGWLETAVAVLALDELTIAGWTFEFPANPTWVQRAWKAHWDTKFDATEGDDRSPYRGAEARRLIHGGNMAITRPAFEKLDGFDERYQTGEDSDLVFRARDFEIVGAPGLAVVHTGEPETLIEFFRQQLWHATGSNRVRDDQGAGRAPKNFAVAVALSAGWGITVSTLALWLRRLTLLGLGFAPLLVVLGLPALRTAWRAKQIRLWAPLAVLYGAYGLARSIKLLGGTRSVRSWRSDAARDG
ncbi:MAG: glycosyltransferase [Acidimicrobiales bacterium]